MVIVTRACLPGKNKAHLVDAARLTAMQFATRELCAKRENNVGSTSKQRRRSPQFVTHTSRAVQSTSQAPRAQGQECITCIGPVDMPLFNALTHTSM